MKPGNPLSIALTLALFMGIASMVQAQTDVTPEKARANAEEAYIYANPIVDSYRIIYGSFVDKTDPKYKAPYNQIESIARVYLHEDRVVQTPNSDTPYSWLAVDLHTQLMVLTVPTIEKKRYEGRWSSTQAKEG